MADAPPPASDRSKPLDVSEHVQHLFRLGLGFCGNRADAEDLVQETLLRAHAARDRFEGRADPRTWLYRIASRVCMRLRRRRAGQPSHLLSLDADPALAEHLMARAVEPAADPSDGAAPEALERLRSAIVALPPAYRLPLVLKELAELSVEETANALGLKPQTVKTRLHRARLLLRQSFERAAVSSRRTPAAPPDYSRRLCLDLLRAKQDALDRGQPLPLRDDLICEHCRPFFSALDLDRDLCRRLGNGPLPPALRKLVQPDA